MLPPQIAQAGSGEQIAYAGKAGFHLKTFGIDHYGNFNPGKVNMIGQNIMICPYLKKQPRQAAPMPHEPAPDRLPWLNRGWLPYRHPWQAFMAADRKKKTGSRLRPENK
jgi:hypothetical protein